MSTEEYDYEISDPQDDSGETEIAIDEASAEWEGGSGEPMARNMTAARYTKDRCYYLISLIN